MSYRRNNNYNNMPAPWQRRDGHMGANINSGAASFGNGDFLYSEMVQKQQQQQSIPYNNAHVSNSTPINLEQLFRGNNSNNVGSFLSSRENNFPRENNYQRENNYPQENNYPRDNNNPHNSYSREDNRDQASYAYNSIGTVTKMGVHWSVVNDDVLFDRSVCRGEDLPTLGSRVLFEAVPNMNSQQPYKWNAKRVQLLTPTPTQKSTQLQRMGMAAGDNFAGNGYGDVGGSFSFGDDGFRGQRNMSNTRSPSMQQRNVGHNGGQNSRGSAPVVASRRNQISASPATLGRGTGGQLNRGGIQNSRGSMQITRGTGKVTRATGQVTRATGRVSRATGQVARGTGQVTRAAGQVARASGQVSRSTGQITRVGGQVNRASTVTPRRNSINKTTSVPAQNKAKATGSTGGPIKRGAAPVVAAVSEKKAKTISETDVRAATKVIDRLEKIPKEQWDEKQHKSLLWAMGVLKGDAEGEGQKSNKNESKPTVQQNTSDKQPQKFNESKTSSSSEPPAAKSERGIAKQRRIAAQVIKRIELLPKDKLTSKDTDSLTWAKSILGDEQLPSVSTSEVKPLKANKERRSALHVIERLKGLPADKLTEKQKSSFAWATSVLAACEQDATSQAANKRQAEADENSGPNAKKPRQSGNPILAGGQHIIVSVVDKSHADGSISPEKWQQVEFKLAAIFPEILKKHPGSAPCCRNVVWYRDHVRHLVACADQRSVDLYKIALAQVGKELWTGAKLEVAVFNQIPSELRVRAWIPAEPSDPQTVLEVIKTCNPELHTAKWVVAQLDAARGHVRSAIFIVDSKSLVALSSTGGVISYGFSAITIEEDDDDEERQTIAINDSDADAVDDANTAKQAIENTEDEEYAEEGEEENAAPETEDENAKEADDIEEDNTENNTDP